MPNSVQPAMSGEEDDAGSQGLHSVIDDILDQYRFNWEPEYRLKFKKELAGYSVGMCVAKPHQASTRLRLTVKPAPTDEGLGPGRFVQKVLVMPQQRFAALYSRKLSFLGFLRCQFVAGYFWDSRRPSLDYRLSTKWNEGLRFKRKEYYQPTSHLLVRARWHLDMQLPDVEGHLGGCEGSTQVPVDVEYGSLDFSVTQLDFVCDLDSLLGPKRLQLPQPRSLLPSAPQPREPTEASAAAATAAGSGGDGDGGAAAACQAAEARPGPGRALWPWQHHHHHHHSGEGSREGTGGGSTG